MQTMLQEIKEAAQDFEWYPTTREIVSKICRDIKNDENQAYTTASDSLLDIGAGNGSALAMFAELAPKRIGQKFAIEKSELLINAMDKDIFVIGTDFYEQTLIDKEVGIIFCNPPYSEYEQWAVKIILEANCSLVYLVIPERWGKSNEIKRALETRGVTAKILGSFDFLESEFRKARAKVNIVKIKLQYARWEDEDGASDPFDVWFDSVFAFEAETQDTSEYDREETKKKHVEEIVRGRDPIQSLAEMYAADMRKLHENYKAVERLDADILKELNVNVKGLKEALKEKLKGTKNLYWQELFARFDPITTRLTSKSRQSMLEKLTHHTAIDFTVQNAYAVVIWAIKNANHYIDEQLLSVYLSMASKENIRGYKSNKRFETDQWRYLSEWDFRQENRAGKVQHFKLDYRLVFSQYNNFNRSDFGNYDYPNDLAQSTHDFINDIFTVAKNLGFKVLCNTFERGDWSPGRKKVFEHRSNGGAKPFAEIRAYKNGNIHMKLCPAFMMALNVEAGRLNGWLRDPAHANEELDIKNAAKYFKGNLQLLPSDSKLLLTNCA